MGGTVQNRNSEAAQEAHEGQLGTWRDPEHHAKFRIGWNLGDLQVRLTSSLQEGKTRPEMGRALLRAAGQLVAHISPLGTPGPSRQQVGL